MAKVKTFAVEVEIRTKVTVYVDARKDGGATERIQTPEGWAAATRWMDPEDCLPRYWDDKTMTVTDVREAGT